MTKVLDKGFVKVIDVMGDDAAICKAARISYANYEQVSTIEENERLINYLMRHGHTSPFEMAELKFHIKAPIQVARQWLRYRTANVNEMSGRYVEFDEEYYVPDLARMQMQSKDNKQGSSDEDVDPHMQHVFCSRHEQAIQESFGAYNEAIASGLAKEVARGVLPLDTYTALVWKNDLHNIFHFLKQRLHSHAQWEIRQYAQAIQEIIKEKFPLSFAAWTCYSRDAVTFSAKEMAWLRSYSYGLGYRDSDDMDRTNRFGMTKREFKDLMEKIDGYGY